LELTFSLTTASKRLHELAWNFTSARVWIHLRHTMGCYLPVISALMFYHSLLLDNEVRSEINLGFLRNFTAGQTCYIVMDMVGKIENF
jgi:hypothetical protein